MLYEQLLISVPLFFELLGQCTLLGVAWEESLDMAQEWMKSTLD